MSLLNKAGWRIISMAVSGHNLLLRTFFRFCRIFLGLLDLFVFPVWHNANYSHLKWHWNSVKKWLPSWSFNVGAISTLRSLYWKLVSNLRSETSQSLKTVFVLDGLLEKGKLMFHFVWPKFFVISARESGQCWSFGLLHCLQGKANFTQAVLATGDPLQKPQEYNCIFTLHGNGNGNVQCVNEP